MIHIYDTSPVTGEKTFHTFKEFLEFLEGNVGADDACICSMYLNCITVSIHIKNTSDRNLYRRAVGDQFDISGIL